MRKLFFSIAIIIVLLLVAAGISTLQQGETALEWDTYTNEEYGVSFEYPANWVVFESLNDPLAPKINVYKPGSREQDLPFDHFANATHVSMYPEGIPTEGVMSEREEMTETPVSFESDQATRYLLENGKPFAFYINPSETPVNWNDAGFVWARAYMPDLNTDCRRDGVSVDMNTCDPLAAGDTIVYSGTPDMNEWEVVNRILGTLTLETASTDDEVSQSQHPLITVEEPQPGEVIQSPLTLRGEARGQWFFEATAPVVLTNWDGLIIAEGFITAQDEWMTTDFVPFEGTLEFGSPAATTDPDFMKNGNLIFQKANASGLPEHDDAYEIRIRFVE